MSMVELFPKNKLTISARKTPFIYLLFIIYSFNHKKKSYKQSYKLVCFTRQGLVEGLPPYHQALN